MCKTMSIQIKYVSILLVIAVAAVGGCNTIDSANTPSGNIVFDSDRDHPLRGSDIYIMDATGDDIRRLTNDEKSNDSPIFSPDGRRIVYISYDNGFYEIIVMNTDGSDPKAAYASDEFTFGLTWSPDGKWLAFVVDTKMLLLHVERGGFSTILDVSPAKLGGLAWSPDSTQIAFSSTMDDESNFYREIYIVTLEDGEVERLTHTPYTEVVQDWSPDGSYLLILSDQEAVVPLVSTHIYLLNLETKVSTPLIDSSASYRGDKQYNAAWSTDGKWIALNIDRGFCIVSIEGELFMCLPGNFQDARPDWGP